MIWLLSWLGWMALLLWNTLSCLGSINISTDVEVLWLFLQHLCLLPENDILSCCTSHYISGLGYFLQAAFLLTLPPLLCVSELRPVHEFSFCFPESGFMTINEFCFAQIFCRKYYLWGNSSKKCSAILHEIVANNSSSSFWL